MISGKATEACLSPNQVVIREVILPAEPLLPRERAIELSREGFHPMCAARFVTSTRSKPIHLCDRIGKRLGGFPRQIVPDAAFQNSVRVLARE
jgi:hypothetical protein